MNARLIFTCICRGQHMKPFFRGRQFRYPLSASDLNIGDVARQSAGSGLPTQDISEAWVPMPSIEIVGFSSDQTLSSVVLAELG